jgi:hypothetical protein
LKVPLVDITKWGKSMKKVLAALLLGVIGAVLASLVLWATYSGWGESPLPQEYCAQFDGRDWVPAPCP